MILNGPHDSFFLFKHFWYFLAKCLPVRQEIFIRLHMTTTFRMFFFSIATNNKTGFQSSFLTLIIDFSWNVAIPDSCVVFFLSRFSAINSLKVSPKLVSTCSKCFLVSDDLLATRSRQTITTTRHVQTRQQMRWTPTDCDWRRVQFFRKYVQSINFMFDMWQVSTWLLNCRRSSPNHVFSSLSASWLVYCSSTRIAPASHRWRRRRSSSTCCHRLFSMPVILCQIDFSSTIWVPFYSSRSLELFGTLSPSVNMK